MRVKYTSVSSRFHYYLCFVFADVEKKPAKRLTPKDDIDDH